jgi:hypothetical protein
MKNTTEQAEAEGAISFAQNKHKLQEKTKEKEKVGGGRGWCV